MLSIVIDLADMDINRRMRSRSADLKPTYAEQFGDRIPIMRPLEAKPTLQNGDRDLLSGMYPYSMNLMILQHNPYLQDSLEYKLFNEGLFTGLKREFPSSGALAYQKGYRIGLSH